MFVFFLKGGFLMYPILACSVAGLTILINKSLQYRRVLEAMRRPANEISASKPAIFLPVLEKVESGATEQEISIAGSRQIREIEKGLSWLGLIATTAPLLGFTGTVTGMIQAFLVIARSTSVSPSMLAGGIWEALITTAAGLLVAVPVHIGQHYLEKQADEIAFLMKEAAMSLCARHNHGI